MIQRADGQNERQRHKPQEGSGGMLPYKILRSKTFVKSCLRQPLFVLKTVLHENRQPRVNLKTWILLKLLHFKMDFFSHRDYF